MRTVELTKGYKAKVSNVDYGRVMEYTWRAAVDKRRDGSVRNVYAVSGENIYMHRLVLRVTSPNTEVDHRDVDGLNNQRSNLRKVTHAQNLQCRKMSGKNTSGFRGVYWNRKTKKWTANINFDKKTKYLGQFSSVKAAALRYNKAAKLAFGKFAVLNF